jgi:FKBP-type peptidyl-prolyl cis-trans isomerase (trigger factor)
VEFPLPKSLVDQEISRMIQQNPYQFSMKDAKSEQAVMEALRGNAEKSVRFSFITDAVKRDFKLEITAGDLEDEYKRLAESSNVDVKEVRKYYMKKENKEYMEDAILRNKVMGLLKEKIKIKEV